MTLTLVMLAVSAILATVSHQRQMRRY